MNFTPIPTTITKNKGSNILKYFLINSISIIGAFALVLFIYITKQAITPKQYITKADENIGGLCKNNNVRNPTQVTAGIENKGITSVVLNDETISSQDISFWWNSIPDVSSYYIALSTVDPKIELIDPAKVGTSSAQTYYKFSSLKTNTTYYLFLRSKSKSNYLAVVYPTPGNCDFGVPSLSVFTFKTK